MPRAWFDSSGVPILFQSVVANQAPTTTTIPQQDVQTGSAASIDLSAFFSDPESDTLTYSVTPTLPAGLSLDANTGIISGTPTTDGTTSFVATADDGQGNQASSNSFDILVTTLQTVTLPTEISALQASATSLVDINLDSDPDWENPSGDSRRYHDGTGTHTTFSPSLPIWRAAETRRVDLGVPGTDPVLRVDATSPRGGTGKALTISDEIWGSNGQWGSDGMAGRLIGDTVNDLYSDLYVECYVKFDPTWQWRGGVENITVTQKMKMFRLQRIDPTAQANELFDYFAGAPNHPVMLLDTGIFHLNDTDLTSNPNRDGNNPNGQPNNGKRHASFFQPLMTGHPRADWASMGGFDNNPQTFYTNNAPRNVAWDWFLKLGDGQYHRYGARVKINSAPGANDGICQIWFDDDLVFESTTVPWLGATSTLTYATGGFNVVLFGGNADNQWDAGDTANLEQNWFIDDMKVIRLS